MTEKKEAVWSDVDFDIWYGEVVFMLMKNKQGVPGPEHCQWYWKCGFGPAQAYYEMTVSTDRVDDSDYRDLRTPG